MAGKVESKKLEEYKNENYYLLWWSETAHVLSPKMAGIGGKGCNGFIILRRLERILRCTRARNLHTP